MQKVLLHCESLEEAKRMRSTLETRLAYQTHISFDEKTSSSIIQNKPVKMMAFETHDFTKENFGFVNKLRNNGFNSPVLVLASDMDLGSYRSKDSKLYYMQKPLMEDSFVGVSRKLVVSRNISQQVYPRYKTHQFAVLESFDTGVVWPSSIFNLSLGGAYCEFSERPEIAVGDYVRIKIDLKDMEKQYAMNAQVVWATRKGACTGGPGIGIKFIKGNDVYSKLLERV